MEPISYVWSNVGLYEGSIGLRHYSNDAIYHCGKTICAWPTMSVVVRFGHTKPKKKRYHFSYAAMTINKLGGDFERVKKLSGKDMSSAAGAAVCFGKISNAR